VVEEHAEQLHVEGCGEKERAVLGLTKAAEEVLAEEQEGHVHPEECLDV
jgi:hypothetical protein